MTGEVQDGVVQRVVRGIVAGRAEDAVEVVGDPAPPPVRGARPPLANVVPRPVGVVEEHLKNDVVHQVIDIDHGLEPGDAFVGFECFPCVDDRVDLLPMFHVAGFHRVLQQVDLRAVMPGVC